MADSFAGNILLSFNAFFSHAALDLDFFSIDDFTAINFEPLAELKIQKDSMKSKTYFRNRQALQQALINEANIDADLLEDLHKFFWSGDSNEDSRLTLAEFKKLIDVDHIDMDETHVHALVSSLFKVSDWEIPACNLFEANQFLVYGFE